MNIVDIRQGDGTYISSLDTDLLVEHLEFVFTLNDSTFLQVFEARKYLEMGLVTLAAHHITAEQLSQLEACLQRAAQIRDDPEAFLAEDIELHRLIAAAAHNPILSSLMEAIGRLDSASRRRTGSIPGTREVVLKDHRAIVEALKTRRPVAAQRAMLNHLNHMEQRLRASAVRAQGPRQPTEEGSRQARYSSLEGGKSGRNSRQRHAAK
jgi:GntR family transcriptional repressor for pyruvate dehydrogenase complex